MAAYGDVAITFELEIGALGKGFIFLITLG